MDFEDFNFDIGVDEVPGYCVECGPKHSMPRFNVCIKSHTFCDFCYETVYKLTGCDKCLKEGSFDREYYMKDPNYDPTVCKCKPQGCRFVSEDPEVLKKHSDGCKFRSLECEVNSFGIDRSCYWHGNISDVPAHFEERHPDYINQMFNDTLVEGNFNLEKNQSSIHLIRHDGEIFYYKHKLDVNKQKFMISVQMVGMEDDANKYFYTYKVRSGRKCINLMEICHGDAMDDKLLFDAEKCAVIPLKSLRPYVVEDVMRFNFSISRFNTC